MGNGRRGGGNEHLRCGQGGTEWRDGGAGAGELRERAVGGSSADVLGRAVDSVRRGRGVVVVDGGIMLAASEQGPDRTELRLRVDASRREVRHPIDDWRSFIG